MIQTLRIKLHEEKTFALFAIKSSAPQPSSFSGKLISQKCQQRIQSQKPYAQSIHARKSGNDTISCQLNFNGNKCSKNTGVLRQTSRGQQSIANASYGVAGLGEKLQTVAVNQNSNLLAGSILDFKESQNGMVMRASLLEGNGVQSRAFLVSKAENVRESVLSKTMAVGSTAMINQQSNTMSKTLPYCDGMSDVWINNGKSQEKSQARINKSISETRIHDNIQENINSKSLWQIYMFDEQAGTISSDYWDVQFEEPKPVKVLKNAKAIDQANLKKQIARIYPKDGEENSDERWSEYIGKIANEVQNEVKNERI